MTYLDGSRFFFDIEGCFSDRVSAARLEHQADEHDPAAEEICGGFADFFGTKPENVRAAKDYATLFTALLPKNAIVITPEFDEAADILQNALSGAQTVLTTVTEFQEAPSTYPEVFELTPFEYSVNIKNISKSDISGDVYVYYKTKVGDLYMGGITYRAKVTDLAAGEEKSAYASHFYGSDSEILFVTYAK